MMQVNYAESYCHKLDRREFRRVQPRSYAIAISLGMAFLALIWLKARPSAIPSNCVRLSAPNAEFQAYVCQP